MSNLADLSETIPEVVPTKYRHRLEVSRVHCELSPRF